MTVERAPASRKLEALRRLLGALPGAVVAYSGGADSAFLAFVAHQVLGDRVVAVTADSPSIPRRELRAAVAFTRRCGIPHRVIPTAELSDDRYVRNDGSRCFFCKEHLMDALLGQPELANGADILLGVNVDDLGDHRPGQDAASRQGGRFPLVEAGLTKGEIRALSRELGLPTWDKPAAACLSSRLAYGVPVTREALSRVERAEDALRSLGFSGDLRVRDQGGDLVRIEVDPEHFSRLLSIRTEVVRALRAAGFLFVTLDLEGYRSGSHNVVLSLGRVVRGR
ncbi:MAG: ATP-dependent sacrificial sulfur transferase LarE [Actinomycetota bacterium]